MEKNKVNAALVEVEATFQAAADDLFSLLTDEKRIPAWSRAPAKVRLFVSSTSHSCFSPVLPFVSWC